MNILKRFPTVIASFIVIFVSQLSCRPIVAIGWPELILLVLLIIVLLGPLLFRLYRFLDKIQKASEAEAKKRE